MKRIIGSARKVGVRTAGAMTLAAVLAVPVLASSAGPQRAGGQHVRGPGFSLRARPRRVTVRAGARVRFVITIRRRRFRSVIALRVVSRAHAGLTLRLSRRRTAFRRVVLVARTTSGLRPGRYRLRVRARGGGVTHTLTLRLTVSQPAAAVAALPSVAVSGTAAGLLEPGTWQPIDLEITNPNDVPAAITNLTVSVQSIDAPLATPALPCSTSDFVVQQFSGQLPMVVPPSAQRSLADLAVPTADWPQVALLDRPTDQDGCQGATVTLSYSATAQVG